MDGRQKVNEIVKEITDSSNNELLFALDFAFLDFAPPFNV